MNPQRERWFDRAGPDFPVRSLHSARMAPILVESIGSAAALLTTLCWVPQAARTIRLRDTRAISLPAQVAFGSGLGLWLLYGLLLGSWPLVVANTVSLVLVGAIIAMKLRYG